MRASYDEYIHDLIGIEKNAKQKEKEDNKKRNSVPEEEMEPELLLLGEKVDWQEEKDNPAVRDSKRARYEEWKQDVVTQEEQQKDSGQKDTTAGTEDEPSQRKLTQSTLNFPSPSSKPTALSILDRAQSPPSSPSHHDGALPTQVLSKLSYSCMHV